MLEWVCLGDRSREEWRAGVVGPARADADADADGDDGWRQLECGASLSLGSGIIVSRRCFCL